MSHSIDQAAARMKPAPEEGIPLARMRQPLTFPCASAADAKCPRRNILSRCIDRPGTLADYIYGAMAAPTGNEEPAAGASVPSPMVHDIIRSMLLPVEGRNFANKAGAVQNPMLNKRTFRILPDHLEAWDLQRRILSPSACLIFLGDVLVMEDYPRRDEVADELVERLHSVCGFFGLNNLAATLMVYDCNDNKYIYDTAIVALPDQNVVMRQRELLILNLSENPLYLSCFVQQTPTRDDLPGEGHADNGPTEGLERNF